MLRLDITLKTGVTVTAHVDDFSVKTGRIINQALGMEWNCTYHPGIPVLVYVNPDDVDAVIATRLADGEAVQDEGDGEQA